MKRKRIKLLVGGAAVVAFVVFLIEGMLYYSNYENLLLRISLSLLNAFQGFILSYKISSSDAYELMLSSGQTFFNCVITVLYCINLLLAPLCTAGTVTLLMRRPASFIYGIFKRKKNDILIIGEGRYHSGFVYGLSKDCRVTAVENEQFSEEEYIACSRKGIRCIRRFKDMPQEQLEHKLRFLKHKNILLCSDNAYENIDILSRIFACSKKNHGTGKLEKVYVISGDVTSDEAVRQICDAEPNPSFEIRFVDVNLISADTILEKLPLYTGRSKENTDIHLGLVGFGDFGQDFLVHALEQAVLSPDSNIRFDVFDKAMTDNMGRFLKRFSVKIFDGAFEKIKEENGRIEIDHYILRIPGASIKDFSTEGNAEIHFWNVDTGSLFFNYVLADCSKDDPFTYMMIAIADGIPVYDAFIGVKPLIGKETPLALCVSSIDSSIKAIIDDNPETEKENAGKVDAENTETGKTETNNAAPEPIRRYVFESDRELFSYKTISENEILKTAKEFNCRYNIISNFIGSHPDYTYGVDILPGMSASDINDEEIDKAWMWKKKEVKKSVFDQESSIALSRHQNIKEWLINEQNYSIKDDKEYLQRIEHRRWNYFMITHGYRYSKAGKDTIAKTHDCLCTWAELKQKRPDVLEYDFVPYLMLSWKGSSENTGNTNKNNANENSMS